MSKRAELSTGEALVGLLEAHGVDTIFGIPGVHNVEMYRALPRSGIRHVLVRHGEGFRMREKKVLLLNNSGALGNLTFLV